MNNSKTDFNDLEVCEINKWLGGSASCPSFMVEFHLYLARQESGLMENRIFSGSERRRFIRACLDIKDWLDTRYFNGVFESPIERILGFWLDFYMIPYKAQYFIGSKRVDMAIPEGKLVIECNGKVYHDGLQNQEKDRIRGLELQKLGWDILPLRGSDIYNDPYGCIDLIKKILTGEVARL